MEEGVQPPLPAIPTLAVPLFSSMPAQSNGKYFSFVAISLIRNISAVNCHDYVSLSQFTLNSPNIENENCTPHTVQFPFFIRLDITTPHCIKGRTLKG